VLIDVLDELPKNAVGKIDKPLLRVLAEPPVTHRA
jgi:acyl-coenzyme A synthetase/AMP-(fatty) acid ligase